MALQSPSSASKNSLSAMDLRTWLYEQHHFTSAFMVEDLAVLMFPAADILRSSATVVFFARFCPHKPAKIVSFRELF